MKKLIALLLASTVFSPVPARAEPISTAIGLTAVIAETLAISTATAGVIGGIIVSGTVSVGATLLSRYLAPKPGEQAQTEKGTQAQLAVGAGVPRNRVYGKQAVAGQLAYWNLHGPDNIFLQLVFTLGSGPHDFFGLFANGKRCTLGAVEEGPGKPILDFDFLGFHTGWVRFYNGFYDQVADVDLIVNAQPAGRWPDTNRGRGVCYAIVTIGYKPEVYPQGVPQFQFEIGARLYDPRKDGSSGGFGAHRWSDQHTWEWSDDPALGLYEYERGLMVGTQRVIGRGLAPVDLLRGAFVDAANVCDETVTNKDASTEKRYRIGMNVGADRELKSVEADFCTAFAGSLIEQAGAYGPIAGIAQDVVATFTDDDLIVGKPVRFSQKRPRDQLVNALFGVYSEPAQNYQAVPYAPRTSAADEAADGGERFAARRDYVQILSQTQAQRVGEIDRREGRYQGTGAVVLGFKYSYLEAGDWVRWISARRNFDKLFRITQHRLAPDQSIALALDETATEVFDFDADEDELDPLAPGDLPGIGALINTVPDLEADQLQLIDAATGLKHPALRALWSPITDRTVDRVRLQYRLASQPDAVADSPAYPPDDGEGIISAGIQAGGSYEIRGTIDTTPVRATVWTDWEPVTAPPLHVVPTSQTVVPGGVDFAALAAEIQEKLDKVEPAVEQIAIITRALQPLDALRNDPAVAAVIPPVLFERISATGQAALTALRRLTELEHRLSEAGFGTHTESGRYTIEGIETLRVGTAAFQAQVQVILDVVNANISLKAATTYVNDVAQAIIQGFQPAYRWEFNGTAEGWSTVSATATPGSATIDVTSTGTSPAIQSPALTLDAETNKIVKLQIKRRAGTNWGVQLQWGAGYANTKTFAVPTAPDNWNEVALDMRDEPSWTGTVTSLRIGLGLAVSDRFEIDWIELGSFRLQDLLLTGVEARVTDAELVISGLAGLIDAKATVTSVQNLTARVSDAELAIDAAESAIVLRATLEDLDTVSERVTNAEATINAALGNIHLLVESSGLTQAEAAGSAQLLALYEQWRADTKTVQLISRAESELQSGIDEAGRFFASAREALEAQVADARARIEQTFTASADALAAEVQSRLALSAQFGETQGLVVDEIHIRAEETAASILRHQVLAAVVGNASAGLVHDTQVLISVVGDATTGLVRDVTNLSVTVGDHSASLGQLLEVDGGQSVRWGIVGEIDGDLGGLVLTGVKGNAGGALFSLLIRADEVIVDGTITSPLIQAAAVQAVHVGANEIITNDANIENARIKTLHLADASVSVADAGVIPINAGNNVWQNVLNVVLTLNNTINGSKIPVFLGGSFVIHKTSGVTFEVEVTLNGARIWYDFETNNVDVVKYIQGGYYVVGNGGTVTATLALNFSAASGTNSILPGGVMNGAAFKR